MIGETRIKEKCKDFTKIENYYKAITDDALYVCHHRLETHFSDGTPRPNNAHISEDELRTLDMYLNRPPEELIFLTLSEHSKLHNNCTAFGPHSKKSKKKRIESQKATTAAMTPEERKMKYGHTNLTDEQQRIAQDALRNKMKNVTNKINEDGYKTRKQLFDEGVSVNSFYKNYELVYKIGQIGAYKHK